MRLVLCEQLKRTPKSRTQQNKSGKEPQRKKKWYHWKWTPFTIAENKLKSHERLNGNWKYFSTPDNHFDEPGATQCILGVNESPSMRLLQDEVKKKKPVSNRCIANNYKFVSQISLRHHSSSRRPRSCKAFGRTSGSCSKHNCIISRSYNRKRKKKSEKEKWKREVYFVFLPTDRQT